MKSELRLKSGNRQYETAALINQSASQSESRLSAEWLLTLICRHSTRKPLLPQWVDNSHTPISIWTAINRRLRIDHARDRGITTEHISSNA